MNKGADSGRAKSGPVSPAGFAADYFVAGHSLRLIRRGRAAPSRGWISLPGAAGNCARRTSYVAPSACTRLYIHTYSVYSVYMRARYSGRLVSRIPGGSKLRDRILSAPTTQTRAKPHTARFVCAAHTRYGTHSAPRTRRQLQIAEIEITRPIFRLLCELARFLALTLANIPGDNSVTYLGRDIIRYRGVIAPEISRANIKSRVR